MKNQSKMQIGVEFFIFLCYNTVLDKTKEEEQT